MYQVLNGEITKKKLPKSGVINGATVMNYHKLPQETLIAEGWLPVEEVKPDYSVETERLRLDSEVIYKDRVTKTYIAIKIPEPEPELEPGPTLEEVVERLEVLEAVHAAERE